jgi:chromosome segregation ATPase
MHTGAQQHSSAIEMAPGEVAKRLGIGTAMLRKHAAVYEELFGSLPKTEGEGRSYPIEVVERLEQALEAYRHKQAASVRAALEAIARGELTLEVHAGRDPEPIQLLLEEFRRVRETVERLEVESRAIREENALLREQLKTLTPPADSKTAYVAEMEVIHTEKDLEEERRRVRELNRRIEYLHQELERREKATQPAKRPWWKVWGK